MYMQQYSQHTFSANKCRTHVSIANLYKIIISNKINYKIRNYYSPYCVFSVVF